MKLDNVDELAPLAPVVMIAFNRADHFKETLDALCQNPEAIHTPVYVCIDGSRSQADKDQQALIHAHAEACATHFASLEICQAETNLGLAKNITGSVTRIVNQHGKIIVLEDDIVVSRGFLKFMNDALRHYQDKPEVWHIAAHTEVNQEDRPNDVFLWRLMNCWGWATWKDRWQHFEKDPKDLRRQFSKADVKAFDFGSASVFWSQVVANDEGLINTWAIFWYATIFKNAGLCVNPWFSYAMNIGFDGSGEHCSEDEERATSQPLNHDGVFTPQDILSEDPEAVAILGAHYRGSLSVKSIAIRVIRALLGEKGIAYAKKLQRG
jgi:hypothetical protein